MRTKNPYKINIISVRRLILPSMSFQRGTPFRSTTPYRQNPTPPRQNYHHRSITPPRHSHTTSCQINRNYRDIESRSHRSISPNERSQISLLKSTVESLINEVNKLKFDKATTSNNQSEYVDVDDTETTGVMGTTGLSCSMDDMGLCDLDANETTDALCDNTNSAIATFTVNPSNKKARENNEAQNNSKGSSSEYFQVNNEI
ncbi:18081_t:CDS:2 [Gigaspora rosea]|nr:18081_t:CDS:2 [Gigaspora rosea]